MVILAAAITTKSGKPILSRQYREMSRARIEGLLTAFPKLAISKSGDKQHTFVETDTVRYVYQPMELIFVILITTKNSNIVEDLETLQLLTRVVKETVAIIEEDKVFDKAFEILMAFDEIISLGYAESLTLDQVKTFLEMESQAENLQNMILESKINDAKHSARQAALDIAKRQKDNKGRTGISKQDLMTGNLQGDVAYSPSAQQDNNYRAPAKVGSLRESPSTPKESVSSNDDAKKKISAFKLVPKKKQQNSLLKAMVETGEVDANEVEETPEGNADEPEQASSAAAVAQKAAPQVLTEAVHIQIDEKISAEISKEGVAKLSEIKGELFLKVSDEKCASVKLQMDKNYIRECQPNSHPNIDKKLFNDKAVVGLKSNKNGFPLNTSLKILTWKLENPKYVPLSVSCWPNVSKSGMSVVMQYELKNESVRLQDVVISIPLPSNEKPKIDQAEQGATHVDAKNGQLVWSIEVIDADNSSGSLEFSLSSKDDGSLFPIQVQFSSNSSVCGLKVLDVVSADGGEESVKYSSEVLVSTEDYSVINE